jgi:hypothetical protein
MLSQRAFEHCAKRGQLKKLRAAVGDATDLWEHEYDTSVNKLNGGRHDEKGDSDASRAFRRWDKFT